MNDKLEDTGFGRKVKMLEMSLTDVVNFGKPDRLHMVHLANLQPHVTTADIRQAICRCGLKKPKEIKINHGKEISALVEFGSATAAELAFDRFQGALLSEKKNMTFLDGGFVKVRPAVTDSTVFVFIYFDNDPRRGVQISTSNLTADKKFNRLGDVVPYLENLSSGQDLVAVFLCEKNCFVFEEKCPNFKEIFQAWTDLTSLSTARFDPVCWKFIPPTSARLRTLYSEHFSEPYMDNVTNSQVMKMIFQTLQIQPSSLNFTKLPREKYLVVVIDIGLIKIGEGVESKMALGTIGMKGDGFDWSCGVDLSTLKQIDMESAKQLGLKKAKSEESYVYNDGDSEVPCLTEYRAVSQFLQTLENEMKVQSANGGAILVTVLDDDTLAYLAGSLKVNGLLRKMENLVSGFSSLEHIFKIKNIRRKMFSFKYLDKYTKSQNLKSQRNFAELDEEPSSVIADVGYSALNCVAEGDLVSTEFIQELCHPLVSETLNSILEDCSQKPELKMFDESCCEARTERSTVLLPQKEVYLPLIVVPATKENKHSLFELHDTIQHASYIQFTSKFRRSNGSGIILARVQNISNEKIRLPRGFFLGLAQRIKIKDKSDIQTNSSGRFSRVDIERIHSSEILPPEDRPSSRTLAVKSSSITDDDIVDLLSSDDEASDKTSNPVEDRNTEVSSLESSAGPVKVNHSPTKDKADGIDSPENISTSSSDLELMASKAMEFLSNTEILTELSNELPAGPTPDITLDNWEELNPTFSNFNIDTGIDVNAITSLESDISLDTNLQLDFSDSKLKDSDLMNKEEQSTAVETEKIILSPEADVCIDQPLADEAANEVKMDIEAKTEQIDLTGLAPLKISSMVQRKREAIPLDASLPLVTQLRLIKEKIHKNVVEGDVSDQFPSLIGQDEYKSLYESLVKYTGCKLYELDFDLLDFGEKVYCEIQNLGLESLDELEKEMILLHEVEQNADLQKWLQIFRDRFESMNDINDLNGEDFDVKMIQWLILHFCEKLKTNDSHPKVQANVRDMIGYPSFEGFDVIEEELEHSEEIGQNEVVDTPADIIDKTEVKESSGNRFDVLVEESLSKEPSSTKPLPVGVKDQVNETKLSDLRNVDSSVKDTEEDSPSVQHVDKDKELSKDQTHSDNSIENIDKAVPDSNATETCTKGSESKFKQKYQNIEENKVSSNVAQKDGLEANDNVINIDSITVKTKKDRIDNTEDICNNVKKAKVIEQSKDELTKKGVSIHKQAFIANQSSIPKQKKSMGNEPQSPLTEKKKQLNYLRMKDKKKEMKKIVSTPPVDPDEHFSDLYIGVKMDSTPKECSVMVFNEDITANAVFYATSIYINGKQMSENDNVQNLLKSKGEDQDLILVYIPRLDKDGTSVSEVSIPLSSWDDNRWFFSGFVLHRQGNDRFCVAFYREEKIHTAIVFKKTIKTFEESGESLQPGLEVNLMVKPLTESLDGCMFRATLCIPNPEKKYNDVVETTFWADKTRKHMCDEDTLCDLEDTLGKRAQFKPVKENNRSLILIKAKDKKSCIEGYNKIMETKTNFERLPGNWPKYNQTLEVFMESVPLSSTQRPSSQTHLQHIAHYTGTTLRLLSDELSIEGYSIPYVELAKKILTEGGNLKWGQMQPRSVVSTTTDLEFGKGRVEPSDRCKPVCTEEEVTSTTGGDVSDTNESALQLSSSTSINQKSSIQSKPGTGTMDQSGPSTKPIRVEEDLVEVLTVQDEEEETLKQIFYSKEPEKVDPSSIEVKLGKNMTIRPGEERSISLSLKQKLEKKYLLRSHSQFEQFQNKLELVMELFNGTSVQVDIKNISNVPVSLKSDQNIVLLEERLAKPVRPFKKMRKIPPTVKKKSVSEGGIKNPVSVNAALKAQGASGRSDGDSGILEGGTHTKQYNVKLVESIAIPPKSVSYAQVEVEKGDSYIYNKVHEIIRHPDFKNSAIFIPERQKKKICASEKLHMSIRNRQSDVRKLERGKLIGQIIVQAKSNKKREPESREESVAKKRRRSSDGRHSASPPKLAKQAGSDNPVVKEKAGADSGAAKIEKQKIQNTKERSETEASSRNEKQKILNMIKCAKIKGEPVVGKIKEFSGVQVIDLEEEVPSAESSGPCQHRHMKSQACKVALLGNACQNTQCLEVNQHAFPADFIKIRNAEFCMDYLLQKVCAKSFAPFVCKSDKHIYDVGDICKFYESYLESSIDKCSQCKVIKTPPEKVPKEKKDMMTPPVSTTEQSIPEETKPKPTKSTSSASAKPVSLTPLVSGGISPTPQKTESYEGSSDDVEIIENPEPDAVPELKLKCAHISLNQTICPSIGFCTDQSCQAAHNINPLLSSFTFCANFLKFSTCSKPDCPSPHLSSGLLQQAYQLALLRAVLDCKKCSFNCKLFNPTDRRYRQDRICFKQYTSKCKRKSECNFIHFSEVRHLKMPPNCKVCAVKGTCSGRSVEKGVGHFSHQQYQTKLQFELNTRKRKCEECEEEWRERERKFKSLCDSAGKEGSSTSANEEKENLGGDANPLRSSEKQNISSTLASFRDHQSKPEDRNPEPTGYRVDENNLDSSTEVRSQEPHARNVPKESQDDHGILFSPFSSVNSTAGENEANTAITGKVKNDRGDDPTDLNSKPRQDRQNVSSTREASTSASQKSVSLVNKKEALPPLVKESERVKSSKDTTEEGTKSSQQFPAVKEAKEDPKKSVGNVINTNVNDAQPKKSDTVSTDMKTKVKTSEETDKTPALPSIPGKFSVGGGSTTQPNATKPSSGGSTTQPNTTKPSSGGSSSQLNATKPSSGGSSSQPNATKPSSGGSTTQPNTTKPSSGGSTTQPNATKPSSGGSSSQPRKRKVCPFYGTSKKCHRGNQCLDIHDLRLQTCRFWMAGHCTYGSRCLRKHYI